MEAWSLVDQSYVDRTFHNHDWLSIRLKAVKRTKASMPEDVHRTIRNMLALLGDPYTGLLFPQQLWSLTSSATGTLAGVGVEMFPTRVDDHLTVSELLDGSPATKSGIRSGDAITLIDGESTDTLTPDDAAARIRGRPGTSNVLIVVHASVREENVNLVRENSGLCSVTAMPL